MGETLGCGASLKSLVRTKYGIFSIEEATGIEQLEAAFQNDTADSQIQPLDSILLHWPKIVASEADTIKIVNGNNPELPEVTEPNGDIFYRAYSSDGKFIAALQYDSEAKLWKTHKVFKPES